MRALSSVLRCLQLWKCLGWIDLFECSEVLCFRIFTIMNHDISWCCSPLPVRSLTPDFALSVLIYVQVHAHANALHIHCTSFHRYMPTDRHRPTDPQIFRHTFISARKHSKEQMHCTWNTSTLHSTAWHRSASHNMTLLCLAYTELIRIACHCICYTLHYVSCFHCRQCMQRAQTHTHTDTQMPMHIAWHVQKFPCNAGPAGQAGYAW